MQPLTSGRRVSTPVWEWMFPTFLQLYLCQKWRKTRVGQCIMSQSFSSVYVDRWPTDATTLSETQHEVRIHQMHFISCFFFFFTVTGQGGSRANTSDSYSGSAQFNSWLGPQLYYTEASRYFLRSTTMRHCHRFGQTTSFHTPHNSLFANHPTIWCLRSHLLTVLLNTP